MKWPVLACLVAAGLGYAWWQGHLNAWLPGAQQKMQTAQTVYTWTDAKGKVHFGDAPASGVKAKKADLPELTVVTMPKPQPEKEKKIVPLPQQLDEEGNPITTPSRQLRNPVLERMGLDDPP